MSLRWIFCSVMVAYLCKEVEATAVAMQDCADRYAGRICRGEEVDPGQLKRDIDAVQKVLLQKGKPGKGLDAQDLEKMNAYFYDENNNFQSQAVEIFKNVNDQVDPTERPIVKILVGMVCSRLH